MSDQARKAYVATYCVRRGKTGLERKAMLEKELKKNMCSITFYVVADVRERERAELDDENPAWTIYLENEGGRISPDSIKEVILEPEIAGIFGFHATRFKVAYKVVFLIPERYRARFGARQRAPKMIISSVDRHCELSWKKGDIDVKISKKGSRGKRRILKDEDFYWL